jgi:chromosome partitioning protein
LRATAWRFAANCCAAGEVAGAASLAIRAELVDAGLPVLQSEMSNRVAYPEAALWGATPSLISWKGPAAKEIAAIADEVDMVLGAQQAAA